MDYNTAKILGGIGGILGFAGIITNGLLFIVGVILILIALYGFSEYYKREDIFKDALIGIVLAIVGAIIGIAAIFLSILGFMPMLWKQEMGSWNLAHITGMGIAGLIVGFILIFVFMVISAIFFRRALQNLADVSGESLIGIAGTIYLVGAVMVIVFGIGFIIIYVALLILGIGFFSMKEKRPPEEEIYKPYEIT